MIGTSPNEYPGWVINRKVGWWKLLGKHPMTMGQLHLHVPCKTQWLWKATVLNAAPPKAYTTTPDTAVAPALPLVTVFLATPLSNHAKKLLLVFRVWYISEFASGDRGTVCERALLEIKDACTCTHTFPSLHSFLQRRTLTCTTVLYSSSGTL